MMILQKHSISFTPGDSQGFAPFLVTLETVTSDSTFIWFQKQPSEVFCKKSRSQKFCKIHRKTLVGLRTATLLKIRLWHRCFRVNFRKFLRTRFFQNTSGRLLLQFYLLWYDHHSDQIDLSYTNGQHFKTGRSHSLTQPWLFSVFQKLLIPYLIFQKLYEKLCLQLSRTYLINVSYIFI